MLLFPILLACTSGKVQESAPDDSGEHSGGTDDTGKTDDTGHSGETGSSGVDPDRYFPDDAIWYEDISDEEPDPTSDAVIAALQEHGWGLGRFQVDFSIEVLTADDSTEMRTFIPTDEFYEPDCDEVPVPVPEGGALEGERGYECASDGDCHLLVAQRDSLTLYEMWRANIVDDTFYGGCLAVWDMSRVYGPEGRGMGCTSADAAGFPIAPLLFSADEVAAGEIRHAIRFILPNDAIRELMFVSPATHSTRATSGGDDAVPYGARLRLRSDYPVDSLPSEGARVVARALQTYGMFLADGGNVALTAQADTFTTAKWADYMESRDLEDIEPQDFELMPLGEVYNWDEIDCARVE